MEKTLTFLEESQTRDLLIRHCQIWLAGISIKNANLLFPSDTLAGDCVILKRVLVVLRISYQAPA